MFTVGLQLPKAATEELAGAAGILKLTGIVESDWQDQIPAGCLTKVFSPGPVVAWRKPAWDPCHACSPTGPFTI